MDKKEIRGIYNVTFNNKKSTPILIDIKLIEKTIIKEVAHYVRGWHNKKRDKGLGLEHIKAHFDKDADGYIDLKELLSLGHSIKEYIATFEKPFIDKDGAKLYEWENDKGARFRCVIDSQRGGSQPPLSPSANLIITFYSDRNVNKQMEFKNKLVETHYEMKKKEVKALEAMKQDIKKKDDRDDFDR